MNHPSDHGTSTLEELRNALRASSTPCWLRLAIVGGRDGKARRLQYMEAMVGEVGRRQQPAHWRYADLDLISRPATPTRLAQFLSNASGQISFAGQMFNTKAIHEGVQWRRTPSMAKDQYDPLPWPELRYQLGHSAHEASAQTPSAPLIGIDAPTFLTWADTFCAFFLPNSPAPPNYSVPAQPATIRWIDPAAAIQRVQVSATQLLVTVSGADRADCQVEVVGPGCRGKVRVGSKRNVRVPLVGGITSHATVLLTRGHNWLDQRTIWADSSWGDDGVEIATLDAPRLKLEGFLSRGEGVDLEFRGCLPSENETRNKVARTVAAFSNGSGGTIVFGIDPDEATITGVNLSDARVARDSLPRIFTDRVRPTPILHCALIEHETTAVVLLDVEPGPNTPYAVAGNDPRFYVRRGATTVPAQPDELRHSVLSRNLRLHPQEFRR